MSEFYGTAISDALEHFRYSKDDAKKSRGCPENNFGPHVYTVVKRYSAYMSRPSFEDVCVYCNRHGTWRSLHQGTVSKTSITFFDDYNWIQEASFTFIGDLSPQEVVNNLPTEFAQRVRIAE